MGGTQLEISVGNTVQLEIFYFQPGKSPGSVRNILGSIGNILDSIGNIPDSVGNKHIQLEIISNRQNSFEKIFYCRK